MGATTTLRYARALFEVAREQGELAVVEEDLETIDKILEQAPEIGRFCRLPKHSLDDRLQLVEVAFHPYVRERVRQTLRVAAENDRLRVIPLLREAWIRLRREAEGIEHVILETASQPTEELVQCIRRGMGRRLGRDIELTCRPNPDLVAGFRLLWQDRLLDNSAAARLHNLARHLATETPK